MKNSEMEEVIEDLQDTLDEIEVIILDCLDPELTREEVIHRIKEIEDMFARADDEDEDDEDEDLDTFIVAPQPATSEQTPPITQ